MLQLYVTPAELKSFHPIDRFVKSDAELLTALSAAAYDVSEELRARGFLSMGVQPPRMFDALTDYAEITKAAAFTSDDIDARSEGRFVVVNASGLSTAATFTLQGSHDATTWRNVMGMDGTPLVLTVLEAGTYSSLFYEHYPHYRYVLSTSESITYSPYLVDSSIDSLIRYRAILTAFLPYADSNTTLREICDYCQERYSVGFNKLLLDYQQDTDGDGEVDDNQYDIRPRVRLYR